MCHIHSTLVSLYDYWNQALFVFSAGIGTGAGSPIFGFLTRNTAPKDRATVFAAVMACRQAGLLIGQCSAAFWWLIIRANYPCVIIVKQDTGRVPEKVLPHYCPLVANS